MGAVKPGLWPGTVPHLPLGGVLAPRSPGSQLTGLSLPPTPSSCPAPEREKRDSQGIIDTLRDTLEERNAAVESLQRALDEADMLCATLKVGRAGAPGPGCRGGEGVEPQPGSPLQASLWLRLGQQRGVKCRMEAY